MYFSFRSFQKHRRARERNFFSTSPTTTPLRWRSIKPLRFIFYHPCSTDFEEKTRGSVNSLLLRHGLAMQCKCSCTMKKSLKSHFFWKYIFLRLLLHRIKLAVCLTFDNSIFKLKTSWDNFSSISWERENEGHHQKSHIFYCSVWKKERKKERKKKRLHSYLGFLPLLVPGLLSQLQFLSMLLNFLLILKSNKNYGKI